MRWKLPLGSALLVSLLTLSSSGKPDPKPAAEHWAQPPGPGSRPSSPNKPAKAAELALPEDIQDKVLPDLDLEAVSLKDFLDFVHGVVPGFQTVVVMDPTVGSEPVLPAMKLKKVTLGQVLSIIQETFPSIEYHPVGAENGSTIYVFKVHDSVDLVPPAHTVLRVYRLTEAVDALAARNAKAADANPPSKVPARKEAMDHVLSLVTAALTQAGDPRENVVVQVHEETQTLIVRGSESQIDAVQRALEALMPPAVLAPMRERLDETEHRYEAELARKSQEIEQLKLDLQNLRTEQESLHKNLLDHESNAERLKIRLEAALKKHDAKE